MKVIGTILADLERSPLGTKSRLTEELGGVPILRRTIERALRSKKLDRLFIIAPAAQARIVGDFVAGLSVEVETWSGTPAPHAEIVRAGRAWALDGWRGGIGGLCAFDEDFHVPLAVTLAQREAADAVVSIPAAAPFIDPAMIDALIDHYVREGKVFRISFVQAPPGLTPVIVGRGLLEDLAPAGQPPGAALTYRPDRPSPDLTGREACLRPAAEIIEAKGRLICDTRRSVDRAKRLFDALGGEPDAASVARWLRDVDATNVAYVPEEIEVELTTEDPFKGRSLLHPGGEHVGAGRRIELATIDRLVESIAGWDDVRIVLAGYGEPTAHPQFNEIVRKLRASSALAVAIRTTGLTRTETVDNVLFDTPVDAIEVMIDAATAETYRRVNGVDGFDRAVAAAEGWLAMRNTRKAVRPLILPSMVKARENLHEMEAFYDGWTQRYGLALLTGYSHRAGQLVDRAVTSMAPPVRTPCRRSFSRIVVLADGRVSTCDQDFGGKQALGNMRDQSLSEMWNSSLLTQIRSNEINRLPLCPNCSEWHRP